MRKADCQITPKNKELNELQKYLIIIPNLKTDIGCNLVIKYISAMDQIDSYRLFKSWTYKNVLIIFNITLLCQKKNKD